MTTLPLDTLTARLRDNARGIYTTEAATELLIVHGRWFERSDFLTTCIDSDAWIGWDHVPDFLATAPCSSSEARILALAAELAGTCTHRPLGDLLTGLDDRNTQLVLMTIRHVLTRGGDRR